MLFGIRAKESEFSQQIAVLWSGRREATKGKIILVLLLPEINHLNSLLVINVHYQERAIGVLVVLCLEITYAKYN